MIPNSTFCKNRQQSTSEGDYTKYIIDVKGGNELRKYWVITVISCLLGGVCSIILGNIIFSKYLDSPIIIWVSALLVIVIIYWYLLHNYRYKIQSDIVLLNITLFIIFIFITPFLVTGFNKFTSIPSQDKQNDIIQQTSLMLKQTKLPYEIDVKESKKQTRKYGRRVAIILVRTQQGGLLKNEIKSLLRNLPAEELKITFYSKNKEIFLGVVINNEKSIVGCSPYELCTTMGIDY